MPAMGRETDCLFVYGTLMIASGHPVAARLACESRVIGPASVPGRLYDFGAYPGALASKAPGDVVHGLVLRLAQPRRTLSWLDAYEGCAPGAPEPQGFMRVITSARLTPSRQVHAWIYCYRGDPARGRHVRNGRYGALKSLARQPS
jgi:gamma-glutamylcyclotransferase (GGCT)/AIG2-like uncharacterized protein YtfP